MPAQSHALRLIRAPSAADTPVGAAARQTIPRSLRQTARVSLQSFLITSRGDEHFPGWSAVTAYDDADALGLLQAAYRPGGSLPARLVVEELSPAEIQLRIGNFDYGVPVVRGIWYPHTTNP